MVDLYTQCISRLVFPVQERLKGHDTVRVFRDMEQNQWLPQQQLAQLQLERLRRLLEHAARHVPYYQRLFRDLNFQPEKIESLADLRRIPLLTKGEIRTHGEALKANNARGLARFNTGGSSGEPLIFWIGKERVSHDVAAKWRATRWWGVDIGDPEIVVWGSPVELGAQDRLRGLRDKLMRTHLLPAFEMSPARLEEFVSRIRALRPRMLFGYPSSLVLIARHARQRGVAMDDLGIKVAFVTAERLYEAQREDIASVFGCPVANGYGGRDAGFIAHQCPSGGMHITAEDIIVEIVDDQGQVVPDGQAGEVVVTHLATRDFPFIRYRTGDVASMDNTACGCGRGLPLLKEIHGRTTDFIIAADGTVMHGLALIYVVRDLPGVANFKIVQEDRHHTRVFLVPGEGFAEESLAAIRAGMKQRLGEDVDIDVEKVADIPRERSGKHRYVVSRVAPSAQ